MKDQCENLAAVRRFWPGKDPDQICVDHAEDSNKIAEAMGVHVHMEPIGYRPDQEVTEFPRCCCSKGFSQTVTINQAEEPLTEEREK